MPCSTKWRATSITSLFYLFLRWCKCQRFQPITKRYTSLKNTMKANGRTQMGLHAYEPRYCMKVSGHLQASPAAFTSVIRVARTLWTGRAVWRSAGWTLRSTHKRLLSSVVQDMGKSLDSNYYLENDTKYYATPLPPTTHTHWRALHTLYCDKILWTYKEHYKTLFNKFFFLGP